MLHYTRREFAKLSLAALPASAWLSSLNRLGAAEVPAGKPNSKVAGVQIGLNVPYSFGNGTMNGDQILQSCLQLGISGLELRTQSAEMFMGASPDILFPKKGVEGTTEKLREWRRTAPLARAGDYRKKFEDAGVLIEIVKVDNLFKLDDQELDYIFTLGKTLGARALSAEISHENDDLKRLGKFADKHQFIVGYHGHATTKPEHWEAGFSLAKYNGCNLDIGHFTAGLNISPVPFLKKYHERITHVHIKDRKFNNGPAVPFGEGDTPVKEVLQTIRDNHWNIQATIEFEYKVPAGSDRMTELARTVKYCREALV